MHENFDYGKHLRNKRLHKGISQACLAEKIGVSDVYVSLIEQGKRIPSLDVQKKVQNVLNTLVVCPCCGKAY